MSTDELCDLTRYFTAHRRTRVRGVVYIEGDERAFVYYNAPLEPVEADYEDAAQETMGDGGPWGWGGFTTRSIARMFRRAIEIAQAREARDECPRGCLGCSRCCAIGAS